MLDEIEVQKKRQIEYKNLRKARGELLMNVRAAFQNMLAMLYSVKETATGKAMKKGAKELIEKKSVKDKTKGEEEKVEVDRQSVPEEIQLVVKSDTDGISTLLLLLLLSSLQAIVS